MDPKLLQLIEEAVKKAITSKRDIVIEVASSSERIKSELAIESAEFKSTLTENVQFKEEDSGIKKNSKIFIPK